MKNLRSSFLFVAICLVLAPIQRAETGSDPNRVIGSDPSAAQSAELDSHRNWVIDTLQVTEKGLNFPILRTTADTFTSFAFLNLGRDPATLTPKAYGNTGGDLGGPGSNPSTRPLLASQQLALFAPEIFNFTSPNNEGWMQVQSDKNTVVGFELIGDNALNLLDGIDAPLSSSTAAVLTDIEYDSVYTTEVHVANTANTQNNLTLELYNTLGIQVGTFPTVLSPKGKISRKIQDIFPSIQQPFVGYLVARAEQDIAAAELLVSGSALAALNGQKLQTGSATPTKLYSAQLGNRRNFVFTKLNLVNPTSRAANLVLRAIDDNGSNLGSSPKSITLGPGQQDRQDVGQLFGLDPDRTTSGSLVIESDITGIVGDISFGDDSGKNAFRASLPLDSEPSKFAAFAHVATAGVFLTGAAAFNPNAQAANVTVKVFRSNGSLVGSSNQRLNPNGRFSKLLFPELVLTAAGQGGGFFTLESDQPISSFALFGALGGGTFTALSAIPPQRVELPGSDNPVPAISSLAPSSATAGGAAFTLTVNGSNFISGSKVRWNGLERATTFVSSTQLTAAISAADIAAAGTASVTVFNPTPGGGTSNALSFTVTAANPLPTISSLSPSSATTGGAAFTLTVSGTNFLSSSKVRWNGTDRTTTFLSSTQLTAVISAADIATAGTASVTVFNPTPGGGTSNALTFTITVPANPVPTTSSLSPSSAIAGGDAFTLTVNGTNLVGGSKVRWNGTDRTTTFVSATQLTAAISAADIATAGTVSVTVFNPAPGGGTSNAQTFTITAAGNFVPTITSISPTSATAGGPAFILTVNGANFVEGFATAGSFVQWNGSDRSSTFVSSTRLTAPITAADIASAGTATVTVRNPITPIGGGVSNAVTFTINAAAPTSASLKADYQFQNTRASSLSGAPALVDLSPNTFDTATVDGVTRTVLRFVQNDGLSLSPTTGLIPSDRYSVVILFAFDAVSGYRRIVEYKNGTGDTGPYVHDGRLNFWAVAEGPNTSIAQNTFVQVVFTRDAAKKVVGYADGVKQFEFTDSSDLAVIDSNATLRFFKDNTSGGTTGEASAGSVARIRLYDGALSATEVAALDRLPGGAGGTCVAPPSGLVSWWPLDGNSSDIQGASPATLSGNPSFTTGKVSQAMRFDGSDDHARVPASTALNVGTGAGFTMDAWIQPEDTLSRPVLEYNNESGGLGLHIWVNVGDQTTSYANIPGTLFTNFSSSDTLRIFTAPNVITPGVLQHIALTYDRASGTARFYINGNQVGSSNFGSFTAQTSYPLFLGLRPSGSGAVTRFKGLLDEVEIFSRALTAAEIKAIYDAGSAGKCKSGATVEIGLPQGFTSSVFASGVGFPIGLAYSSGGSFGNNLYVGDAGSSGGTGTILKFDGSGVQSTFAANITGPISFAIDPSGAFGGDLYVANDLWFAASLPPPGNRDIGDDTIKRVKPDGSSATFIVSGADIRGEYALTFGTGGNFGTGLYMANVYPQTNILRFQPNGAGSQFSLVRDQSTQLGGIAFSPGGGFGTDLFVGDSTSSKILKINSAGTATTFVANIAGIVSLAFDPTGVFGGDLFAASFVPDTPGGPISTSNQGKIYRVKSDGTFSTFASGLRFRSLAGGDIAFGFDGDLFVLEDGANRILRIKGGTIPAPGASCITVPSGMAGWWPGDGNANDIQGTNNGTVQGGVTFSAGAVGQAFNLDGSSGYISTNLDVQPSVMPSSTWDAWVFPTRVNFGGRQQIFSNDDGGYDRSVLIESGTSKFVVFTGSGIWEAATVTPNQWQHIAVVFTPTNIEFYKNGVMTSFGSAPSGQATSTRFQIGHNPGYGEFFQGLIDEVEVFSRALTAAEIKAIFDVGSAGKCKGTQAANPNIDVTPASLDFGNVTTGQSKDLTLTVRNTGNATLSVSSVTSSNSQFAVTSPAIPFTVPAGGQQTVNVRFAATATGAQAGNLTIASNDPSRPSVNVALTGTGSQAQGTAPAILNAVITRLPFSNSIEVDVTMSDPDGDIVRLDFDWFAGGSKQTSTVINSPTDTNLAGFTAGTKSFVFAFTIDVTTLNRVDIQASDSKGNQSNKFTKTF